MRPSTALFVMAPMIAVVVVLVLVASRGAGAGPSADGVWWDEGIVQFVRQRIATSYVDEIDETRGAEAFYDAMDAYLHHLDPYCDFISPEEYRQWRETTSGRYGGLGIRIQTVPEGLEIMGLFPGGPADQAGLHRGDVIVSADGTSIAGMDLLTIEGQALLKGEPGSTVVVGVIRGPRPETGPNEGPVESVSVRRDVIQVPTVFDRRVGPEGRWGVIRLTEFADQTGADFDAALARLIDGGVKGLVLDLRHNGGGVLPTAVTVVDRFVSRGVIVRMEGRGQRATRQHVATPDGTVAESLPLVVLVDRRSASASEVVAGALQDHRRAVLVGERTYGKFLVQQITDIPGREAAVQLTTSRYYLPSGRSYQRRSGDEDAGPAGILPDLVVELSPEDQERLAGSWANEAARPWGEAPPHPEIAPDWIDPQLARALDLLEGQRVLRRIEGTPGGGR